MTRDQYVAMFRDLPAAALWVILQESHDDLIEVDDDE